MKIVFDTNVVLDVLLNRQPFAPTAIKLMSWAAEGRIEGLMAAHTVTTVYYLSAKSNGSAKAREQVRKTVAILEVAPVSRSTIDAALDLPIRDFEDAVIAAAAEQVAADAIVSRDKRDFVNSKVPVYTPMELMEVLGSMRSDGVDYPVD